MNANNLFSKEKKRKLSNEEESSGKKSKKKNEDIKPNVKMISKNIKKEPDFMVKEIKQELDFAVREIKKEQCLSDTELATTHLTEIPLVSRRRKQKVTRTKTVRKATSKNKKRTSKKCRKPTRTKKTKGNIIAKKSTKKRKTKSKRKNRKKSKSLGKSSKSTKKEANTLLDRQSNGNLYLFGFKDELEYFSIKSDLEEFNETNSERGVTGKRTSLSSLGARKKVILALKSTSMHPTSKPKPVFQPPKSKSIDVLGSILESQALWHSKNSHMKVNDDGSVEIINKRNKKPVKMELTSKEESNLQNTGGNNVVSTQMRSDPSCTRHTTIEPILDESLNLNENIDTHLTRINIKTETCNTVESLNMETMIDDSKEQLHGEQIKVEGKEEKKDLLKFIPPILPLQESSFSISESTLIDPPKIEKSSDDEDDCPIFSIYSKASKMFSLQRDKERQTRFMANQSEIQLIEVSESEKTKGKEKPFSRHKNYQEKEKIEN